jgi:TolA-binding protein
MTSVNPNPHFPAQPPAAPSEREGGYAPSVPISIYRQLAAELQATKGVVDSLSSQNQQLTRQNQMLRQEIQRVVQTTVQLGQFAGVAPQNSGKVAPVAWEEGRPGGPPVPIPSQDGLPPRLDGNSATSRPQPIKALDRALTQGKLFSETGAAPNHPNKQAPSRDLGGLWLALSVFLIVITAFGAGFIIMRPILSNNR